MRSFDKLEGHRWYHCKVFLETELDEDRYGIAKADSPVHYLLVNEVFHPILQRWWDHLYLWRFHRMFRTKDEGLRMSPVEYPIHQFKWKFYALSGKDCFEQVARDLAKGLKPLEEKGLILKYEIQESTDSGERIGSDRDKGWPHHVKRVWPYYIHGASLAWYRLVIDMVGEVVKATFTDDGWEDDSLDDRLALYGVVAGSIKDIWMREGNNPFLHHLNVLFGYHKIWYAMNL